MVLIASNHEIQYNQPCLKEETIEFLSRLTTHSDLSEKLFVSGKILESFCLYLGCESGSFEKSG
jgi:hypothetical protein